MLAAIANERFDTHVHVQHHVVHAFLLAQIAEGGVCFLATIYLTRLLCCTSIYIVQENENPAYPSGGFVFPEWRNMEHATSGLVRCTT